MSSPLDITCFSDVLCIWAYVSQARIDALTTSFGDAIRIRHRFCSVFGTTGERIPVAWKDKGSYEGFNAHLLQVAGRFPHVAVHSRIWLDVRPCSSASPHLFLKAVQQWVEDTPDTSPALFDEAAWALRCAFFRDCRDISRWDVQCDVTAALGVDIAAIEARIHAGQPFAGLAGDYQAAERMGVEGSPTMVLNEGRQKLYGNVGFRVMEANVQELLRAPRSEDASWC